MRWSYTRLSIFTTPAALLTLPLLLVCASGCGSSAPGASGLPLASPSSEALAAWAAFPVNTSPRPLVLVGPIIDDPTGGFTTGASKGAYIQGEITPPASMPTGPSTSQGFHLISAADAFHKLTTPTGHMDPPVSLPALVTTAVHLGSATFQTDRGPRELPAWMFSFANVTNPASVLAVAPQSMYSPKPTASSSSSILAAELGQDGKTLTISFVGADAGTGPCTADYSLQIVESKTAVAVQVGGHANGGSANCNAVGYHRQVTAALSSPLASRVLVDASTGSAITVTRSSTASQSQ